ncbi:MAG TPA: hypothetical protein VH476_03255 [Solirubrobacterales bacterium]|jgi:hypothetical protein
MLVRLVGLRGKLGMAVLLWRFAPRKVRRVALGAAAVALLWAVTLAALIALAVYELT